MALTPSVNAIPVVVALKATAGALKGNSVGPQGLGGWGGGAAQLRLLLSVERASTTLDFNAWVRRRRFLGLGGNNGVEPLERRDERRKERR